MIIRALRSGSLYLWIGWICLAVIWICTTVKLGYYLSTITIILLLGILYFAEGMEIAVADLLDKQLVQITSVKARSVLSAIKPDSEWFFAQRQVFVVVIISLMSLLTIYPSIEIPFLGSFNKVAIPYTHFEVEAPFWFSFVFTSFTVLWWCQVFPKRLAVRNSEKFLHQSSFVWGAIRLISRLNLPGPANVLVILATRFTSYKKSRHLKPSRTSYYDIGAMLYGFSLDRASTKVVVRDDGSASVTQRQLLLFAHGRRDSTSGSAAAGSEIRLRQDRPKQHVEVKSIHICPVPERIERIIDGLDLIFQDKPPPQEVFEAIEISDKKFRTEPSIRYQPPRVAGSPQRAAWELNWSPSLPESYWVEDTTDAGGERLAILLYEVRFETEPGAYQATPRSGDYYIWTAETPCRNYAFTVIPDAGNNTNIRFSLTDVEATVRDRPVQIEKDRIKQMIKEGSSSVSIEHPLPGISYKFLWKVE